MFDLSKLLGEFCSKNKIQLTIVLTNALSSLTMVLKNKNANYFFERLQQFLTQNIKVWLQ